MVGLAYLHVDPAEQVEPLHGVRLLTYLWMVCDLSFKMKIRNHISHMLHSDLSLDQIWIFCFGRFGVICQSVIQTGGNQADSQFSVL